MFQRLFALRSASTLKRTRSFPLINLKEKASTTNRFSVRQTSSGPCPKSVRISNEIYLPILSGEAQNEKKNLQQIPSASIFGNLERGKLRFRSLFYLVLTFRLRFLKSGTMTVQISQVLTRPLL